MRDQTEHAITVNCYQRSFGLENAMEVMWRTGIRHRVSLYSSSLSTFQFKCSVSPVKFYCESEYCTHQSFRAVTSSVDFLSSKSHGQQSEEPGDQGSSCRSREAVSSPHSDVVSAGQSGGQSHHAGDECQWQECSSDAITYHDTTLFNNFIRNSIMSMQLQCS